MTVSVTLIGTHRRPFLRHPWLYHYGWNWQVQDEGPYTPWVQVEAPGFPRHDKTNGKRFTQSVEVKLPNIKLSIRPR